MIAARLAELAGIVTAELDRATAGAAAISWLDFPDYENVGDSAIWLGQLAWARAAGVPVRYCLPQRAMRSASLRKAARASAGMINGGGNLGGLWPNHQSARLRALRAFEGRRLVQAPQTVAFTGDEDRRRLLAALSVVDARLLVRDARSLAAVRDAADARLCPDAAHLLGPLSAPPPRTDVVMVLRRDKERAHTSAPVRAPDWPTEPAARRRLRKLECEALGRMGAAGAVSSGHDWEQLAVGRLARGIDLLASGRVVVTDRLHAMILSLHLGRRVIAVDTARGKLRHYADTWFDFGAPDLYWATDADQAMSMVDTVLRAHARED